VIRGVIGGEQDFAQIGLIVHLFSLLVPAFGASRAGLAMGLVTAMAITGRTLIGWTMPVELDAPRQVPPARALLKPSSWLRKNAH